MSVPWWLSLSVLALQCAAFVCLAVSTRRVYRLFRHAMALDALLARLCIEAFARDHQPIWKAWMYSMGDINVEVTQSRKLPGAEP